MFRLEIPLGRDNNLSYEQIAGALKRVAAGLVPCTDSDVEFLPEAGDHGTLAVDGQRVGTWEVTA